ncbi:hypothetical protein HAALTHF_39890n [Vreelandella aquamarina]|nr:hypothetical protein HAALTHF_39890n [Halomonas axialensis]
MVAITGGARGLGFAIAKRLGKGAQIALIDMSAEALDGAVSALGSEGYLPMHLLLMWQTSNRFSMSSLISPSAWGLSVAV